MRDLDKALADIVEIRSQLAYSTAFQGFGPTALGATSVLALVTASVQSFWMPDPNAAPLLYFTGWIVTALVCVAIIGAEMLARTRRRHSGLADAMIVNAVQQFVPAGVAGAFLALVVLRFAPEPAWMLPGIWQVLVSLGIFASARTLPRAVTLGGAWYFVAGFAVLMICGGSHTVSPWAMGIPFAGGQLLLAAILYFSSGEHHGQA
ncbi:hypothetical protein SAMN05216548_10260 [Faunimonas pinastri]|uniref:Uncharacterized protein n=1 Tax=Faunimonas pinastri TaxID=1855383 RepID=A0A1H9C697_9HYPH|nr:hypothetical protein [Faunimonas pinastri]SEP96507.1 hypothetical protein SAMN05216548_10260 [Faunimonas pinastri]